MKAQHKSFIRRSQAAQSPLPSLDGKGAPTAAQARERSAKVCKQSVLTAVPTVPTVNTVTQQLVCIQQFETECSNATLARQYQSR